MSPCCQQAINTSSIFIRIYMYKHSPDWPAGSADLRSRLPEVLTNSPVSGVAVKWSQSGWLLGVYCTSGQCKQCTQRQEQQSASTKTADELSFSFSAEITCDCTVAFFSSPAITAADWVTMVLLTGCLMAWRLDSGPDRQRSRPYRCVRPIASRFPPPQFLRPVTHYSRQKFACAQACVALSRVRSTYEFVLQRVELIQNKH